MATELEVRRQFARFIDGKTQIVVAKELGVSVPYVHDIIHGRRSVLCPAVLKKFGLKKVAVIKKIPS